MTTTTRVYAARRITTGLYVQPSNDLARTFVVGSYEDGRSNGLTEGPWRATFWRWGEISDSDMRKLQRLVETDAEEALSLLQWIANQHEGYATKREAVEAALNS